jgi:hypothetical protein
MLTLEGNPFSSSGDYRSHVLAHLSSLNYLDHRLVTPVEVQAALEVHQASLLPPISVTFHGLVSLPGKHHFLVTRCVDGC